MKLSFVRVLTWNQALILMEVRNQCRDGMTHNTDEITVEQQEFFWRNLVKPDPQFECYLLVDDHKPVGYGLLKWDGERYWMTAGIVPEYRGKKLSRLLINYITEMGHREDKEVWIDVYDDNAALYGDIRVGYVFVSKQEVDGKVLHIMRHERDRILHMPEVQWMVLHGKYPKSLAGGLLEEVEEVDKISRETYR